MGRTVTLHATGATHFAEHILDEYGAPKLSQLTTCGAPDVPELHNPLAPVILSAILQEADFPKPIRRLLLNFLRRALLAVNEYRRGRSKLLDYVERLPEGNNHFLGALRALSHFEQSIAALYQATVLSHAASTIVAPGKDERPFKRNDGTPLQRLNALYNRSKHFTEPAADTTAPPPATPIWLTNEGFECSECRLSYVEFVELLGNLREDIAFLERLPALLRERRQEHTVAETPHANGRISALDT